MNNWRGGSAVNENTMSEADIETLLSHQLRTPLSAIKWFTEMMLDGDIGNLTPTQRKYLAGIQEQYQQTAAVIDELLQSLIPKATIRHNQGSINISTQGSEAT